MKKEVKDISWKDVVIVELSLFCLACNTSYVLPFSASLSSFGQDSNIEAVISFVMLIGSYMVGRALSSPLWIRW
jgi:hypothetical protein